MSKPSAGETDFDTLVIQCLRRIRASAHAFDEDPETLAQRVAGIVRDNVARGRVPRKPAPHPQTGVPDSYIDEVLGFIHTEGDTLHALRERDEAAWLRVMELLCVRAYTYLMRGGMEGAQARQLAEDLAQACSVTLWEQALERFPYDTQFEAWVSRIAAYEVSQWRRSGKEQREQRAISLDGVPDSNVQQTLYEVLPDLGASRALDEAEARMTLAGALEQLASEEQRQTVLRQLRGESDEEIASALGRSKQAIYNLRYRALRALRRILSRGRDQRQ